MSGELRMAFDEAAEHYHAVRPRYPEAMFDTLVETTRIFEGARLLEIGPGTGQATEPLARRGYDITAIEIGSSMAAIARSVLRPYPNVRVVQGAFEDVDLPAASFDLVYAATAFHWIEHEHRFVKPHRLLVPGGHLAILYTEYVSDEEGDVFFHATQPIYEKYYTRGACDPRIFQLPRLDDLRPPYVEEELFERMLYQAFPIVLDWTAEEYAQLVGTFSPSRGLAADARAKLLEEMRSLIDTGFGGRIQRRLAMTLTVAKRKA